MLEETDRKNDEVYVHFAHCPQEIDGAEDRGDHREFPETCGNCLEQCGRKGCALPETLRV